MVNSVLIVEQAQIEIQDALNYYKELSPELSDDLLAKFRLAVSEISLHPNLFQPIRGEYRKINLERFPYKIVFRVDNNALTLVALAHHKRKAFYWKNR